MDADADAYCLCRYQDHADEFMTYVAIFSQIRNLADHILDALCATS